MEVKEKWKRGFSKVQRQLSRKDSNVSLLSSHQDSVSVMEEEDINEDEVEAYLTKLKSKTGLKNLWSGHKFEGFVDNDHTPDISLDSDDELNMKFSMNADQLRQLTLDSDEDEMRIDYMRGLKHIDKNNNEVDLSNESEDEKSINLMNNIHFAELEIGEVELSDTEVEKVSDFLPQVYTLDPDNDKQNGDSNSEYSELNFRQNIHMLDDISEETTTQKINNRSYNLSSKASSVYTEKDEIKEEMHTSDHASPDRNVSKKDTKSVDSNSHDYSSNSHGYSSSDFESAVTSPRKSKSSPSRKIKSRGSSRKTSSRSSSSYSKSKSRSDNSYSHVSVDRKVLSDSDNTLRSTETLTSQTSSTKSRKKSRKSSRHSPEQKKHSRLKKSPSKNISTQTRQRSDKDDLTEQVLNFSYTWKPPSASNLANHVVDVAAMDILTNYNPAVLAANDMMKFHLDLLKRHITDSQRLYDAYSKEGLNTNYRYTSYENTLKYIQQNRPKVISFEDALKEIKEKDNDDKCDVL